MHALKIFISFNVFFYCFCIVSYGQELQLSFRRNSFFAEYALEGPDYSVNYDRIFARSEAFNFSFRAGISILNNQLALPLGLNVFTGKKIHHAELSFTATPLVIKHAPVNGGYADSDKMVNLFPGVGYRYQKSSGGIFFRVIAGPLIILDPPSGDFWNMDPSVRFSFVAGMGFSFGK